MEIAATKGEKDAQQHEVLSLQVRYIASRKQHYQDPKAAKSETLEALKPTVLDYFGLAEGAVEGGGTKSYYFVHDAVEQTDMSVTLGQLAGDKHELKLDLLERFQQG